MTSSYAASITLSSRRQRALGAAIVSIGLAVVLSVAPPGHRAAADDAHPVAQSAKDLALVKKQPVFAHDATQHLTVTDQVVTQDLTRPVADATPGSGMLVQSGTNADWVKLILLDGGWPQSDNNVTVLLQWMVRENGPQSWFLRNNPLNNGYGSGGGGGLGSYANLQVSAAKVAENLSRPRSGYEAIVAALAASAPPAVTAQAIWESPWATSHYGNGSRWTSGPVQIVKAPASAWQ